MRPPHSFEWGGLKYFNGADVGNVFRDLADEAYFTEYVTGYFIEWPQKVADIVTCQIQIEEARVAYAYNAYMQGVEKFSLLLQSGDPDHYKRAGALLHALYLSQPIVGIEIDDGLETADTLTTALGVTYQQAEDELAFASLYAKYHNELTSFALAYACCRQYVENPRDPSLDYLRTVCVYLGNNGNLSVESLYLLFKSLMQ